MCAVSMIADDWRHRRLPEFPWVDPPNIPPNVLPQAPSKEEFDRLKKEVEKLKKELQKAKEEDIANNEPDCDMEDKTEILEKVGRIVGILLEEFFSGSKTSKRK